MPSLIGGAGLTHLLLPAEELYPSGNKATRLLQQCQGGAGRRSAPWTNGSLFRLLYSWRNRMLIKAPHKLGGLTRRGGGHKSNPYGNYRTVGCRASIVRSEQL